MEIYGNDAGLAYAGSRVCPPIDAPEADKIAYRNRIINRWSIPRMRNMARAALNMWYYMGLHYAEIDPIAAVDPVRGAVLRSLPDTGYPRPTTNYVLQSVLQDLSTIMGRGWKYKTHATSGDAMFREAAKKNERFVNNRLRQLDWENKQRYHILNFITCGTAFLTTYWDRPFSDTVLIGSSSAAFCASCQSVLADPTIDLGLAKKGMMLDNGRRMPVRHMETATDVADDEGTVDPMRVQLNNCPYCEAPTPLQPMSVVPPDYVENGKDVFGRSLGSEDARGVTQLDVDQIHEYFAQDSGVLVHPWDVRRYGRSKIRHIEWIYERYPDLDEDLSPDSPIELLWDDPIFGQYGIHDWAADGLDAGILDYHKRVDEIVEEPSYFNPMGRYIVLLKDRVLEDVPLLYEEEVDDGNGGTETVCVPRMRTSIAQYIQRFGSLYATGLPEPGLSPQNRVNGVDSGFIEGRNRMGPFIIVPPGMWIEGGAIEKPGFGKFLSVRPDPGAPDVLKPEVWGGPTVPTDMWEERDRAKQDALDMMRFNSVRSGAPVKNVGTTSGLNVLLDQDEQARSQSQGSLTTAIEQSLTHISELQWLMRKDKETISYLNDDGTFSEDAYDGAAFLGQTEIEVEIEPAISASIVEREAVREAIADKVWEPTTPYDKKLTLEAYGVKKGLGDETNNQLNRAEERWSAFLHRGVVGILDQIEDAGLYYAVYVKNIESEEGQRLTKNCGWNTLYAKLAGWELDLANLIDADQKTIAFYGGRRLRGAAADQAYADAQIAFQKKDKIYQSQMATYEQQVKTPVPGVQPPMMPVAPTQPPAPMPNMPTMLQDRVEMVWMVILQEYGLAEKGEDGNWKITANALPPPDPKIKPDDLLPAEKDPFLYVKIRALVAACKLTISGGLPQGGGILSPMMLAAVGGGPDPKTGASPDPAGGAGGAAGGGANATASAAGNPEPTNPESPGGPPPTPPTPDGGAN